MSGKNSDQDLFEKFKLSVLSVDPVSFIETNLTIDGEKFDISGGYKPFADIYRYICLKAVDDNSMPVLLVKGRQVGGTVMAAAIESYFIGCGLYGNGTRAPMRVMHLFPTLGLAAAYTKTKLTPIIQQAKSSDIRKANGTYKSILEAKMDTSSPANDNMHFKRFVGGNEIWIESTGLDGDRIRGRMINLETELPTPTGFIKLKDLREGDDLFDENGDICQITKLHPIHESPESYKITFDNGMQVDACAEHLWPTHTKYERENNFKYSIRNTREILDTFNYNHSIPACTSKNLKGYTYTVNNIFIKNIEPIAPVPMRCITVNSPSHLYLITRSFIPTHNTVDCIIFDEVQDMPVQAIGAADKTATRARYGEVGQGIKLLFGTPKQKGGAYWNMWQASNQQYYHLRCEKCNQLFPLYRPDVDWEEIWLYEFTVKCTSCGHKQDKNKAASNGKWLPLKRDENDEKNVKMIGYHINQLYIPRFKKEHIISQKPGIHPTNTERVYMNEILGEFFDGEGGTISKEEIIEKCLEDRPFASSITPADNIRVYAGFDWGQKANLDMMAGKRQGKSYSCAVVLTAHGPELFSVEFATKLNRNDMQEKQDIVEEMFRRYSVSLSVGDIGDAHDLTEILQRKHGDVFLGSRAANHVKGNIKFNDDVFPKEIVFDRDYYISELFDLLRRGCIKFPRKSWSQVEWLINHCCSMEVKVTTDRKGDPIRHYIKGSTPNDGFMALLNAYLAWKFDVTQKFNINNPANMQHGIAQNKGSGLTPILGYIPRMR